METQFTHESIALCFLRVFTGMLFLFQGYDKIFRMRMDNLIETIKPAYLNIGIPISMIRLFAYFTSYIELVGGFLLILGLLKITALYALGFDLLIASIGMAILNPMWDMKHVFPRLILVIFLIIYPTAADLLALDHIIF